LNPIVSIITPTFNQEKYIEDCINSVLRQTVKEWEMIIIDDGSTDTSPGIIRRFDDSRIIYRVKKHRGMDHLGETYNDALDLSKGEYILILEGDDFIPANRIEIQLSAFEDRGVVLSHGKYAYVLGKKIVVYPTLFENDILNNEPLGSALKAFLHGFNPIGTQSVMVRKSALLEVGGFTQPPYLPLVDYPTWMRLSLSGRFVYIPQVLGYWRRHAVSVTMNRSEEILNGYMKYCDEFITFFDNELKDLRLKTFIDRRGAIAYLSLAWIRLSNKDWGNALRLARKSWNLNEGLCRSFRIKIVIAIVSAYLHLDIPKFLKKMAEFFYREEMSEGTMLGQY